MEDTWNVAGLTFRSRLIVGTGRYKDLEETGAAIAASGAEIVTVAVRRVNLSDAGAPMLQDHVDPKKYTYLPNTAGCFTAQDAVRTLRLAREAGGWNLVKLEVLGPPPFLYPDMRATFEALEALIKDGFQVMVYCSDDPIAAKRLEEMGAVAVMPLGAPIGSGLGIQNPVMIRAIIENAKVPVLVDAGVGTASDAAMAMERGADDQRHRPCPAAGADGPGHDGGGGGRAAGLPGRADAAAIRRRPLQPAEPGCDRPQLRPHAPPQGRRVIFSAPPRARRRAARGAGGAAAAPAAPPPGK